MIEFTHPLFLWLAVGVLPVLIWGLNRSLAGMTRLQKKVCAAVRFLLLSLLILALAGFTVRWRSEELAVVYVLDQSASLSAEAKNQAKTFIEKSLAHQHSGDTAAVVGFAKKAELLLPPTENLRSLPASGSDSQGGRLPGKSVPPIDSPPTQPLLRSVPLEKKPDSATDIGGALKFSSALFPQEKAQRIVLLSDGNDTESRAGQVAQELAQRGIEVFTVPLCNPHQPEVLVERVEAPRRLKAGEPFDLKARIESNTATTVTLRLYENKFLLTQRELALKPGSNELTLPNLRPADRQFLTYDLEIVPPPEADTVVENNRAETTASLRGQPHVLLIDSDETKLRPMAEALRKPGHVCTIVHSLAAAREELLHGRFDVIVTDLVMETETAGLDVLDERRDRMIKRCADIAHALRKRRSVHIGVHVPDEARRDRHKTTPSLAEPPRHQQQLAERLGVIPVVFVIVPLLADAIPGEQRRSIVSRNDARIFSGKIKRIRHPAEQCVESLLLNRPHGLDLSAVVDAASEFIEG